MSEVPIINRILVLGGGSAGFLDAVVRRSRLEKG
jgi:hypothetical protein